jgi:hypothetical protein
MVTFRFKGVQRRALDSSVSKGIVRHAVLYYFLFIADHQCFDAVVDKNLDLTFYFDAGLDPTLVQGQLNYLQISSAPY